MRTADTFELKGEPGFRARYGWRLRALLGDPIPTDALGFCFDQMTVLLRSGMSIPEAFQRAARVSDPELSRIADAVVAPVSQGMSLTRALAPWSGRFPAIVLPVLEVGETAGTMEGSARRLADAFQVASSFDRKYRYAVFDPWLVILALTGWRAVTHLGSDPVSLLEEMAATFLILSACYLGGRLLLRLLFRWQALRLAIDTLKLALPQFGTVARNLAAARWGRSFVTLWRAGAPISQALEVSSRSALNAHYERALLQAACTTRQGATLRNSLAPTGLLPRHLLDMLGVGETGGNLDAALDPLLVLLEAEAYTKGMQQLMLVVTFVQVLVIVLSVAAVMR